MTPGTKSIENGNGPSKRKRTKVSASTSIEVTAIVNEAVAEETEGQSEQLTGTATATKTPTTPPVMTQEEDENDSQIVPKESFLKQLEINFAIPKELNVILVDDWNFVLRERKLLTIPAKVNVVTVLKNFVEWQKERTATSVATTSTSGSSPEEQNLCIGAVEEFVEGIKDYFNVMLGSQLLYRFERIQFAEILEKYPGKKMMEIYGSFHLLRMFVRLGATISHSLMDEKCIQLLQFHVKQLLTYLSKNNVFDFSEYYPASPEYIRKTL